MHGKTELTPTVPLPLAEIRTIEVPEGGCHERDLFPALGLTSMQVYPLLGTALEFPHDVRYVSRPSFAGHYFTANGVRALVDHFRLHVEVREHEDATCAGNDGYKQPALGRRDTRPWWVQEGLA